MTITNSIDVCDRTNKGHLRIPRKPLIYRPNCLLNSTELQMKPLFLTSWCHYKALLITFSLELKNMEGSF